MTHSDMNYWFTADTHFGHKNIIKYTDRPFGSVEEMDEALIANWNARVAPDDEVYHLGDFALNSPAQCRKIIDRLNGKIHLIRGNHDNTADACADQFVWIKDYHELKIPDPNAHRGTRYLMLLHYAMRVWNGSHHGTYHLFGHSHGTLEDVPTSRSIDVGVDVHGFAPISYAEVKALLEAKSWVSPLSQS